MSDSGRFDSSRRSLGLRSAAMALGELSQCNGAGDRSYGPVCSVTAFGATGDPQQLATKELQAAMASGESLAFPAGVYHIDEPLVFHLPSGRRLIGAGMGATRIVQLNNSSPILKVGGARHYLQGFQLEYPEFTNDRRCCAIDLAVGGHFAKSIIENISVLNASVGILLRDRCSIYSVSFRGIDVLGFSIGAFQMAPGSSGTGFSIDCLYLQNARTPCSSNVLALRNLTDGFVGTIAVEHCRVDNPPYYLESCETLFIGSMRAEAILFSSEAPELIRVAGRSGIGIGALQANYCEFSSSAAATVIATTRLSHVNVMNAVFRDAVTLPRNISWHREREPAPPLQHLSNTSINYKWMDPPLSSILTI